MAKKDYSKLEKDDLLKVIEKLESRKKYGLIWDEEKTKEQFEKESENALPVLKEVKGKEIKTDPSKPTNILIEGDNYHALSVLNYTHQGKIDVIYIDPPYNTGNKDFKYNDRFVDKDDSYRHSKWLSFMSKRLRLAKTLLSDDGVIFVSIGDDEQSNLKLLMDDIFGEQQFVSNVPRLAKTSSDKGTFYAPSKDFVLVYKSAVREEKFNDILDDEYKKRFKGKDERGDFAIVGLYQAALDPMRGCSNQRYFIICPDGTLVIPPGRVMPEEKKDAAYVIPKTGADKVWRWSYASYLKKKELLVFKRSKKSPLLDQNGNPAQWNIYTKYYLEDRQEDGKRPRDWMDSFPNTLGSIELADMQINFSYPKPSILIAYLINIACNNKDAIILDFFAGSGTTGHAVSSLNKTDDGKRTFILCTNNEENICTDICYPRIQKVIKGYKTPKGEKIDGLGGNLKYYKTAFVKNSISRDDLKMLITRECTEMLCLREGIFDEVKAKPDYHIFEQNGRIMGVYYSMERDSLAQLKKELDKMEGEKILYCFTFDPLGLDKEEFVDWKGVSMEAIPQPILDIYKEIYNL